MRKAIVMLAWSLAFPAFAGAAAPMPLVGTWRLVTYRDTPEGGAPIEPFGVHPIGQFIFTATGQISVSIMRNPPDPAASTGDIDPDACHPAWYCSYFGTYTVDAAGQRWTTHVVGGNIPSFLGTRQSRTFSIAGDRLTIAERYRGKGDVTVSAVRVLERVR